MSPNSRQMTSSNRNLGPAGALGSAGKGAPDILPTLFPTTHHHDMDHPASPALAIARVGGQGGQIYVYADEPLKRDSVDGSPRGVRDSLMSYLLSCSHPATDSTQDLIPSPRPINTLIGPLTPPSSYTPNVNIPQYVVNPLERRPSLPLTPASASNVQPITQSLPVRPAPTATSTPSPTPSTIPLISDLFPSQASAMEGCSHALEIVTPPDHIIHGFVLDHQLYGRSVYIHLRPPHSSSERAEDLAANFSEVLRPHDPSRLARPSDDATEASALDIRESLTALLDLASDSLDAKNLVLVLDKTDRENAGLDELLHSLMYVGGQVVRSGLLEGGWEWDATRWILVGMEL